MSTSIRQALQYVADHPEPGDKDPIDTPIWELVSRALFDIANNPKAKVRGSMARSTRAQKILLTRLVGTRRPGTNPVAIRTEELEFVDMSAGGITI